MTIPPENHGGNAAKVLSAIPPAQISNGPGFLAAQRYNHGRDHVRFLFQQQRQAHHRLREQPKGQPSTSAAILGKPTADDTIDRSCEMSGSSAPMNSARIDAMSASRVDLLSGTKRSRCDRPKVRFATTAPLNNVKLDYRLIR